MPRDDCAKCRRKTRAQSIVTAKHNGGLATPVNRGECYKDLCVQLRIVHAICSRVFHNIHIVSGKILYFLRLSLSLSFSVKNNATILTNRVLYYCEYNLYFVVFFFLSRVRGIYLVSSAVDK